MKLVLASQSPRRKQLLAGLGYQFEVRPSNSSETFDMTLPIDEALINVAMVKGQDILRQCPDDVILSADTIVYDQGKILGKPKDAQEAFDTLKSLSGRGHEVKTAVVVMNKDYCLAHTETSHVIFKDLSDEMIWDYVNTGTCLDKAGSYGIQDIEDQFVEKVEGSYSNVVGLPMTTTDLLLKEIQRDPAISV